MRTERSLGNAWRRAAGSRGGRWRLDGCRGRGGPDESVRQSQHGCLRLRERWSACGRLSCSRFVLRLRCDSSKAHGGGFWAVVGVVHFWWDVDVLVVAAVDRTIAVVVVEEAGVAGVVDVGGAVGATLVLLGVAR